MDIGRYIPSKTACGEKLCSDDNSGLFNKKSVLQTKYRPLFLRNTDQIQTVTSENTDHILKSHSEECKTERRDTV